MSGTQAIVADASGLLDWQTRMGFNGVVAARTLGLPYQTYREYLPGGRRRQGTGFPVWLGLLCRYVETYGVIAEHTEEI